MKPISTLFLFLMAAHAWAAPSGFDKALEEKNWAQLSQMIETESNTMNEENFLTLFRACKADHTSLDREDLLNNIVKTITKDSILQYPTVLVEIMKKDLDLLEQDPFYEALERASDVDRRQVMYSLAIAHCLQIMPKNISGIVVQLRDDITDDEVADESLEEFTTTFLGHFTKEELQQGIFDIANRAVSKNSHRLFQRILEEMMQGLIKYSLRSFQESLEEIIQKIKNDSDPHEKMASGYVAIHILEVLKRQDLTDLTAEEEETQAVQTLKEAVEQAVVAATGINRDGTMVSEYAATQILETLGDKDPTVLNTEILSLAFLNATEVTGGKMASEDLAFRILEKFPEKFEGKASELLQKATEVTDGKMVSERLASRILEKFALELDQDSFSNTLKKVTEVIDGEMVAETLASHILRSFSEKLSQDSISNTLKKATEVIDGKMVSETLASYILRNFSEKLDPDIILDTLQKATEVTGDKMVSEDLALVILETFPQKFEGKASELFQKAKEVIGEKMVSETLAAMILQRFPEKFEGKASELFQRATEVTGDKMVSETLASRILETFPQKFEGKASELFQKSTEVRGGKMMFETLALGILRTFPQKFDPNIISKIYKEATEIRDGKTVSKNIAECIVEYCPHILNIEYLQDFLENILIRTDAATFPLSLSQKIIMEYLDRSDAKQKTTLSKMLDNWETQLAQGKLSINSEIFSMAMVNILKTDAEISNNFCLSLTDKMLKNYKHDVHKDLASVLYFENPERFLTCAKEIFSHMKGDEGDITRLRLLYNYHPRLRTLIKNHINNKEAYQTFTQDVDRIDREAEQLDSPFLTQWTMDRLILRSGRDLLAGRPVKELILDPESKQKFSQNLDSLSEIFTKEGLDMGVAQGIDFLKTLENADDSLEEYRTPLLSFKNQKIGIKNLIHVLKHLVQDMCSGECERNTITHYLLTNWSKFSLPEANTDAHGIHWTNGKTFRDVFGKPTDDNTHDAFDSKQMTAFIDQENDYNNLKGFLRKHFKALNEKELKPYKTIQSDNLMNIANQISQIVTEGPFNGKRCSMGVHTALTDALAGSVDRLRGRKILPPLTFEPCQ